MNQTSPRLLCSIDNAIIPVLTHLLGSIVVSIPACHAGDRGSIPRRGAFLYFLFPYKYFSSIFLPLKAKIANMKKMTGEWMRGLMINESIKGIREKERVHPCISKQMCEKKINAFSFKHRIDHCPGLAFVQLGIFINLHFLSFGAVIIFCFAALHEGFV